MIKEGVKKKKMTKTELEEALLDNFVKLQRVLTNMTLRFDELSQNTSRLLEIFEIAAKSFIEKHDENQDKELLNKLDTLVDQNKTIARGLTLMEEKIKHKLDQENHTEAEHYGIYPGHFGTKPRPGNRQRF